MKKYMIYSALLVTGLIIGWLLFGTSSDQETVTQGETTIEDHQMWTCSMHPQIMQPDPGDCPICGMELIPATTDAGSLNANQFKLTDHAMALANIQTETVGKGNVGGTSMSLSGMIAENEEANTVQISYFSGRIQGLNVNFTGEKIRKGQLLATLYSPELYAAQQELLTAASLKDSQPELYTAVRNKLKLWKLSDQQINEIEYAGKVKEYLPVYATVSGTVTEKMVEEGDYVKQGQPLLKIADLNTVWANFDVYENQIDNFSEGQDVVIRSNSHPDKEFKGKVDFIDPVLQTKTRTVTLRVVLKNKNNIFKPGMFVSAKINSIRNSASDRLSIPSSAVLWTGKRSVVYLKSTADMPVFEMREVILGNQAGDQHEVLEGLSSGDEIVTNGAFSLDAAAQLQGKKSMMNKGTNPKTLYHEMNDDRSKAPMKVTANVYNIHERVSVDLQFKEQLSAVFDVYIKIKDALVQDDPGTVVTGADELLNNLVLINPNILDEQEVRSHWNKISLLLKANANTLAATRDIEKQRAQFKELSTQLAQAVQKFGVGQVVYYQFCPMADDNHGAYWLSNDKNVLNPYFGSAMLSCGSVKQVIRE